MFYGGRMVMFLRMLLEFEVDLHRGKERQNNLEEGRVEGMQFALR